MWERKGKPVNQGWHISKEEIIKYALGKEEESDMYSVIIDVTPSRKQEVNLMALAETYVFTYGHKELGKAQWSNLMLKVREILGESVKSEEEKIKLTKEFRIEGEPEEDVFTFLYLHGDDLSWNFGRLGQMNAVLLYKEARGYFKQFFH